MIRDRGISLLMQHYSRGGFLNFDKLSSSYWLKCFYSDMQLSVVLITRNVRVEPSTRLHVWYSAFIRSLDASE